MNIYFIAYNIYGMGGTVKTVVNTANALSEKGYKVEIISLRRTSKKPIFDINTKVKVTPIMDVRHAKLYGENLNPIAKIVKKILLTIPSLYIHKDEDLYKNFSLFSDIKIINVLKKLDKGVVVTTIPSLNVLGIKYLNKNIVHVGQEHKPYDAHTAKMQKFIKRWYDKLDILTCLTKRDLEYYSNINKNIYQIPNGTEVDDLMCRLNNKVVISAGRLSKEKGFDLLIKSFQKVVEKHPDWQLRIFGDGVEKDNLVKQIFELELYNNVFIYPTTNKLKEEMLSSSIYTLSSRYESFGMVIIEAMAIGLPCVSFKCEGPLEIISDGIDGILVERENCEELANKTINLIEDFEARKKLGIKAKQNVIRYSMSEIANKWDQMISESSQ